MAAPDSAAVDGHLQLSLGELHLCIDLLLLHLVLKLLLPLGRLVECDFLLQRAVLHLLILEQQVLDLSLQLLQHQLILLHNDLHILRLLELI